MYLFSHSVTPCSTMTRNTGQVLLGAVTDSRGRQITALGQDEESKSDGLCCLWLAR